MRLIDLTGQRFGRWTVLERAPNGEKTPRPMWFCRCECGVERTIAAYSLRRFGSVSCGCDRSFEAHRNERLKKPPGRCARCRVIYPLEEMANRTFCRACARRSEAEDRKVLRANILAAYGGACACCGESHSDFLAVDHKNGGGNAHRRKIKAVGGRTFYQWLKNNEYPAEFSCCAITAIWPQGYTDLALTKGKIRQLG